jgi:hypothetical protein
MAATPTTEKIGATLIATTLEYLRQQGLGAAQIKRLVCHQRQVGCARGRDGH